MLTISIVPLIDIKNKQTNKHHFLLTTVNKLELFMLHNLTLDP